MGVVTDYQKDEVVEFIFLEIHIQCEVVMIQGIVGYTTFCIFAHSFFKEIDFALWREMVSIYSKGLGTSKIHG